MENKNTRPAIQGKNILRIVLLVMLILLVPLLAMQFTDEVNWDMTDFMVAGALLVGTGLIYELLIKRVKSRQYRLILSLLLIVIFLLVWAELAVGIFGTPFSGQ